MISDCKIKLQDDQLIVNLRGISRRGSWYNLNYSPGICMRRKITDNCIENSRYSGRKSNLANVEYKASHFTVFWSVLLLSFT